MNKDNTDGPNNTLSWLIMLPYYYVLKVQGFSIKMTYSDTVLHKFVIFYVHTQTNGLY